MEKFEPTNIKGAGDRLPAEQIMRNRITDVLRKNFELYGYAPLETAMLNYLDLLTYKYDSDAEIVREIYKLKDQGDRDLGLRFDLTIPFCKVIAMNRNLRLPFKRYEIGRVWRNGPVKAGRAREFYQCDVDAVGIAGQHIEAELIALSVKCFLELGIEPVIKYGNRTLLAEVIKGVDVATDKIDAVIGIVDKMAKISAEELHKLLCEHMPGVSAKKLISSLNNCAKSDEISKLEKNLVDLGVDKYCVFAPYLARGLNYYTGNIWEVFDKAERITSSLGGGGRYDNIIANFIGDGRDYPAVGLSFGLEPILAVLAADKQQRINVADLMLIPMGTESFCQKLADKMRVAGRRVLVFLGSGRVGKALEYADAEGIPYVAVVGENEIQNDCISIKDMKTGETEEMRL